jgi:hypothetical protein
MKEEGIETDFKKKLVRAFCTALKFTLNVSSVLLSVVLSFGKEGLYKPLVQAVPRTEKMSNFGKFLKNTCNAY